jgi:hypothetical protein
MASRVDTPVQLGRALSEFDAFMEGRGTSTFSFSRIH